jgi:hypothetical protein
MASVEYSDLRRPGEADPKPREALMLVAASGSSYGETASLCGWPVGTVKSRVNRTRTELARILSVDGPEDFETDAVFRPPSPAQIACPGASLELPRIAGEIGFKRFEAMQQRAGWFA